MFANKLRHTLSFLAIGLIASSSGSALAADIQARTMKFGHLSTADSPLGVAAYKFAELVSQKSGGKIQVKIFNSGQLGNEVQQIGATQGGTQEFALFSSTPLTSLVKDLQVLDFPGLMENPVEADALLDGPIGQQMLAKFQEKNLVGLSFWENGFRQFTNSKRRIQKVEDISGLKVRVIQNPIYLDMFKALGANPVAMSFSELYSALETHTVDAQDNAMATNHMAKFNEVQKYLTLTRHIYNPMVVIGSKKMWDSLSTDEKKIIADSLAEARNSQRKLNREKEAFFISDMKHKGMTVDELAPAEVAKMKSMMQPVIDKYGKQVGEVFVKQVYAEMDRIRGKK